MSKQYETVIGLEVHVELATRTKIFCGCSTAFGGAPNTHTCPVCTGMPGSLPVLNKKVVDYALRVGLAANCKINQLCKFDRKNYFYPDNPQNYQISQLYLPICHDGYVEIDTAAGKKKIGIHEIHMEEDAGKLIHDEWEDCSLVDYNRSGVPLIEIVSEPDMRSAEEVIAYLEKLRMMIQYLGASDCKLQEGSMRADVNLSVREVGSEKFGTRTEMKNLNSFKAIGRAIEGERARHISDEWIDRIVKSMPEFQPEKQARYVEQYGLPQYDAGILTGSKKLSDLFEETTALCGKPKKVANWLMGETLRLLKENGQEPEDLQFSPKHLASLIELAEAGSVNNQVAKEVFEQIFAEDVDPEAYVEEHGLKTVNDTGLLEETARKVLENNPGPVEQYKSGKTKVLGFLVGQVMKEMKGKANPAAAGELLQKLLSE